MAKLQLERRGYSVAVACNGRVAVDMFKKERFDVVLMDIQMPELGGVEATAAMREIERARGVHTPIIALTAHSLKGDRERYLAAGMDAYASKPIQTDKVLETYRAPRFERSGYALHSRLPHILWSADPPAAYVLDHL